MSDDFVGLIDLQSVAQECGLHMVLFRKSRHAIGERLVFQFFGQIKRTLEFHVVGDVTVHLRKLLRPDGLKHRLDVALARRDIVTGQFAIYFRRIKGQLDHKFIVYKN